MIELQQPRRYLADFRQRFDSPFIPEKMLLPGVDSWIIETNQRSGTCAHRAEVRTLVPIAVKTSERQILLPGQSSMLHAKDRGPLRSRGKRRPHGRGSIRKRGKLDPPPSGEGPR